MADNESALKDNAIVEPMSRSALIVFLGRDDTRIIVALGTSWLLDGLEVTLSGSLSGVLQSKQGLSLTDPQVTGAATTYLAGAVLGALFSVGSRTDAVDADCSC
jgi:hypothetical protein